MIILMLFRISGHSMLPMFKPGQILLVSSIPFLFRKPRVGDVVVVKDPQSEKPLLKRITKVEGEKYFVAGDNPDDSRDSREFGLVSKDNLLGKLIMS